MEGKKFVTAINCIDGRTQDPVSSWMKKKYNADFVDAITEPGIDKVLAEEHPALVESIKCKVAISTGTHHSKAIGIVGHYDCAANPVSKEEHIEQVKKAVQVVKKMDMPCDVEVFGLWVGEDWTVEVI